MNASVAGGEGFSYVKVELDPGESVIAESDAMATMDADLDVKARFNGGFFAGLLKRFLGRESMFVNWFSNATDGPRSLTLVQPTPGQVRQLELQDQTFCLQPGSYLASTPSLKVSMAWAGFRSFIAREGLFRIKVSGTGTLWFGAFGGLLEREIDGDYIVDTSHLVAYEPQLQLKLQLAGGLFSSIFGGEGLVTRVVGKGKIVIQTRSMETLAGWVNPLI